MIDVTNVTTKNRNKIYTTLCIISFFRKIRFCSPFRAAEFTASDSLSTDCGMLIQLHRWRLSATVNSTAAICRLDQTTHTTPVNSTPIHPKTTTGFYFFLQRKQYMARLLLY